MTRIVSKFGIAAALTLGMYATAAAQTGRKTTPTKTIPVTKEAAGEVAAPIHDTVTVTVNYTVVTTRYRRDTVTVSGPTITRYDTTTLIQTPGWLNRGNGMYFGIGAGSTFGNGGLSYSTIPGYAIQMNLGYDPKGSILGVRATAAIARPDEQAFDAALGGRPAIGNFTADLKLRLPFFRESRFPMFGLYAVGGVDYSVYKDLAQRDNNNNIVLANHNVDSDMGWNLGGGATLEIGHSRQLFFESRMISFHQDGMQRSGQQPIILGINWY